MNKPDFGKISKVKKELTHLDEALKEITDSEKTLQDDAVKALTALKAETAAITLKETPVSALNASKQGIRLSALKDAGYENIGDLTGLKLSEIDNIKGIGSGSASTIFKTLREMEKTVYENSSARLSASSRTPRAEALVTVLYKMIHSESIRKNAQKLYSSSHKSVIEAISDSSVIGNSFFWLFSSRSKKERVVSGCEKLSALYESSYTSDSEAIINDFRSVYSVSGEDAWNDFLSRSAYYFSALEDFSGKNATAGEIAKVRDRIRSDVPEELADAIDRYELNLNGLKTKLRSYQAFGTKYALYQEKTLLGDEMGLGKTVQAVAAMVSLSNEGKKHFIVICPASVLINWVREIKAFSSLTPLLIRDSAAEENARTWIREGGVAIVNYEAIPKFREMLPEEFTSDMTVVDEAHYIKNPEARRTIAAGEILSHSEKALLMSGTPLENRIEEMKNLIRLVNTEIAEKIRNVEDSWSGDGFRKKIAPVYLRRTREDVLTELPELIEKEEICPVTRTEKEAYRLDVNKPDFMGMRQVSFKGLSIEDSSKIRRIKELCDTAGEQGRKIIVFSYFKNTLEMIRSALGERTLETINGSMPSSRRQEIIDEFTKSSAGTVLTAQIVAGGTGLNIQAASVVILAEPQIKPSLETQAISRAYRMGQLSSVLVYRLISDDTIDEDIMNILKTKQDIFDKFADDSEMADAGSAKWIAGAIESQQKLFGGGEAPVPEANVNTSSNP